MKHTPLPTVTLTMNMRSAQPDAGQPGGSPYYVDATIEFEVLTVHLEKNTMRVRSKEQWLGKWETYDVSAEPFFERYAIVGKGLKRR